MIQVRDDNGLMENGWRWGQVVGFKTYFEGRVYRAS